MTSNRWLTMWGRCRRHAFEAEKTEANDRSQGRMLVYPKEDHFQRVYNVYIESSSSSAMTPEEMAEEALAGKVCACLLGPV